MTDPTPTDRIIAAAERTVGYPLHAQTHKTAEEFAAATGLSIEMIEAHGITSYNSATGVPLHVLRPSSREGA